MKIIVSKTYDQMCQKALTDLINIISKIPAPLLCVASGDSPKGIYQHLCEKVFTNLINVSGWSFVGLDEWVGLNGEDEGSCQYHLNNHLFNPLNVTDDRLCFYNGRAKTLEAECNRIEEYIKNKGGIDIAVVGLGMNGHVGMNEPGTAANHHSHVAEIAAQTQAIGQKYFSKPQSLTHGLTMGLANLAETSHVFLIVSGKNKAEIVKKLVEADISDEIPATFLRTHPSFTLYLDEEAGSLISIG